MAFRSSATALGIKIQSAVDVPATITAPADLLACYDLRPAGQNFTLANPEYTGSVDQRGDAVVGRDRSVSFNIILNGPGGTVVPAADTYVPGRILRAARFFETAQVAPLHGASPVGATTTSSAVLTDLGAASDDFYNGIPIIFSDQGIGVRGVSMFKKWLSGTKTAILMETFPTAPAANFSIPAFLGYRSSPSAPEIYLSVDWWLDKKRYKMVNATVSSLTFNFPVSNRAETANAFISVTLTGDVHPTTPELDEVAPAVPSSGRMVPFRDGDLWFGNARVCGSSLTADLGIRTASALCPNNTSGGEAVQIVAVQRTAAINLNELLVSQIDFNNLASGQLEYGVWAQFGNSPGKTVSFGITDGRIGFSEADPSGEFVTRNLDMYIDNPSAMSLVFPYF